MRCREARRRINTFVQEDNRSLIDPELLDHLHHCPNCAKEAMAVKTLRQMLDTASENITENIKPLDEQKKLVTARMAGNSGEPYRRRSAKPVFMRLFLVRPTVGLGLAGMLAMIMFLTLIPFNYTRTVGYEIAFDGVDKELADDVENICDILFSLGLDQADVDILGCDTTCSLLIVDLKSTEEVQLVITAFTNIDPSSLTTNIIPVQTNASGTLLDRANETFRRKRNEIY